MQRWHLPLCALLLLSLVGACSQPSGLVLVVTVDPPTSGEALVELRATVQVDGKATTTPIDPIQVQPGAATRFSLKLDQGTRGKLALTVEGRPNYAYVTHKGTKTVQLDEDRRYDTNVALKIQTQCSDTGWCWEHARPRGNALSDVWGTGPNDIWVVGEGGTILHYDGWAFSSVPIQDNEIGPNPVPNARFTAVHGTSKTDVWAISNTRGNQGQSYALLQYDSVINKFIVRERIEERNATYPGCNSLWVTADTVWVDGVGIAKNISAGIATKEPQTNQNLTPGRAEFYRIFGNNPDNPNDLWAVGAVFISSNYTPAVWHLNSNSKLWERQAVDLSAAASNVPLYHIWGSASGDLWASARDGNFNLKKVGEMWVKDIPPFPNHNGIIYGANSAGAVLAISGNIQEKKYPTQSRDTKKIFRRSAAEFDKELKSGLSILRAFTVPGQSPPTMFLVGEGGLVQRYDVDAKTDPEVLIPGTSESSAHLNDVLGVSDKDIWAVGNQGLILHYNGVIWVEERPAAASNSHLRALWGATADDVWAVGDNSTILHRTSATGGFVAITSPVSGKNLNAVWGTSAQNVYIAGDGSTLLNWNGNAWMAATSPGFSGNYQAVWASDQSNVLVAGFSGTTGYVYRWNGSNWLNISPPGTTPLLNAINKMRGSSSTNIVITHGTTYNGPAGSSVLIYDGTDWVSFVKESPVGTVLFSQGIGYIVGYEDALQKIDNGSKKISIGGSNFLNALWGTAPTNLWAVGESGTILHYQDLRLQ